MWTFAYGSNMNLCDLRDWLIRCKHKSQAEAESLIERIRTKAKVALLENHRLVWNFYSGSRSGGAANIEKQAGGDVYGVAFQIDQEWRDLFDCKEGHPNCYSHKERKIRLIRGQKTVSAWVYYAEGSETCDVWPTADYKAVVVAAARCWKLPKEYVRQLENVPTKQPE